MLFIQYNIQSIIYSWIVDLADLCIDLEFLTITVDGGNSDKKICAVKEASAKLIFAYGNSISTHYITGKRKNLS